MLHTTRAIVLKCIRHGDRTVVLKLYTEAFGLRSMLARTGTRSGIQSAALQPLNRVEVVMKEMTERDLHALRELRVMLPYQQVPFDPVRGTLALFVQEVLYRVLRGEAADPDLFAFLWVALEAMDSVKDVRNFPLVFLLQLSGPLGFQPTSPSPGATRFDLKEGEFVRGGSAHGHTLGEPLSMHLASLLDVGLEHLPGPAIRASDRRELLDHLLLYYRMHVEGLGELRSPAVLHQVLG
jgi:DNA repair protein RecO (recombination protein O)